MSLYKGAQEFAVAAMKEFNAKVEQELVDCAIFNSMLDTKWIVHKVGCSWDIFMSAVEWVMECNKIVRGLIVLVELDDKPYFKAMLLTTKYQNAVFSLGVHESLAKAKAACVVKLSESIEGNC